ncbi:hypothetical protein L218DRAFT_1063149, partial [Marasmius fiardii PR-910]
MALLELLSQELPDVPQSFLSYSAFQQLVVGELPLPKWSCRPEIAKNMHPDVFEFVKQLKIPALKGLEHVPNLLLEGLDNAWSDDRRRTRSKNVCVLGEHRLLINTPGSGKTRTILEALCHDWGFYFVCRDPEIDHIGSRDLIQAFDALHSNPDFKQDFGIGTLTDASDIARMEQNQSLARRAFLPVLLSRFFVFHQFLKIVENSRGTGQKALVNYHMYVKRWLDLQLQPTLVGNEDEDIFAALALELQKALFSVSEEKVIELLFGVMTLVKSTINSLGYGQAAVYIVLDEAQEALNCFPRAFSSTSFTGRRPVLREILHIWGPQRVKAVRFPLTMVVTGTGISLQLMNEALLSVVVKRDNLGELKLFGAFDNQAYQYAYIQKFVPTCILNTDIGRIMVSRIWYWLQGRYRFTAGFLSFLLENGYACPNDLLDKFIRTFCGCLPTDCPRSILISEKEPRPDDTHMPESHKTVTDDANLRLITQIAYKYQTGSVIRECFGDNQLQLLQYGFARINNRQMTGMTADDGDETATYTAIDERLVLTACAVWLNNDPEQLKARMGSPRFSLYSWICEQFHYTQGTRNFFEVYLLYNFLLAFGTSTPLNPKPKFTLGDIFNFGVSKKKSTNEKIQKLKSRRAKIITEGGDFLGIPGPLGFDAGETLDGHEAVQSWLAGDWPELFCFPNIAMGPDLLFALELDSDSKHEPNTYVWVAVQAKQHGSTLSLPKSELEEGLRSVTPSAYCVDQKPEMVEPRYRNRCIRQHQNREETLDLLDMLPDPEPELAGKHSLIRVIAAWPAVVNFDSVVEDPYMEDTEGGHPIASLNIDKFKDLTK